MKTARHSKHMIMLHLTILNINMYQQIKTVGFSFHVQPFQRQQYCGPTHFQSLRRFPSTVGSHAQTLLTIFYLCKTTLTTDMK